MTELHEGVIGVGECNANAVRATHGDKVVQREPIKAREGCSIVSLRLHSSMIDCANFFVPNVWRTKVETECPRLHISKVGCYLVTNLNPVRMIEESHFP